MLVRKISVPPRDAVRCEGGPMTVAEAERWPEAGHGRRPVPTAFAAAVALHAAVLGLALTFTTVPPASAPLEDQTVELVFAPPPPSPAEPAAQATPAPDAEAMP